MHHTFSSACLGGLQSTKVHVSLKHRASEADFLCRAGTEPAVNILWLLGWILDSLLLSQSSCSSSDPLMLNYWANLPVTLVWFSFVQFLVAFARGVFLLHSSCKDSVYHQVCDAFSSLLNMRMEWSKGNTV